MDLYHLSSDFETEREGKGGGYGVVVNMGHGGCVCATSRASCGSESTVASSFSDPINVY